MMRRTAYPPTAAQSSKLASALHPDCHTGPQGIHANRQQLKARKLDEMDLLALTTGQLNS